MLDMIAFPAEILLGWILMLESVIGWGGVLMLAVFAIASWRMAK